MVHSLRLAIEEAAEGALRLGERGGGLVAHDLDYAAHIRGGAFGSDHPLLAHAHDAADVHAQLAACGEQLLGVVEEVGDRDSGSERGHRSGQLDEGRVVH
ncbi:Uncharacterised protein [Collinsella intestinalis]|nr:Uncharacterised protein [Collinsella intestinalis]